MAAILIKVGALALKTLAKPLSQRFQNYVMSHPQFREQTIRAAQKLHRFEVLITRGAEGRSGRAFIADMTEEKSLELASKLASEGFVFGVGIVIIAFEYERQRRKEMAKKAQEMEEKHALMEAARAERERLSSENKEQQELIHRLMSRVDKLEGAIKDIEAINSSKRTGIFGGFFGPRALAAAG